MYIFSLIHKFEELTDSQIKLFKYRVFSVIDKITMSSQAQRSSFVTLLLPQSGFFIPGALHILLTLQIRSLSESIKVQESPSQSQTDPESVMLVCGQKFHSDCKLVVRVTIDEVV